MYVKKKSFSSYYCYLAIHTFVKFIYRMKCFVRNASSSSLYYYLCLKWRGEMWNKSRMPSKIWKLCFGWDVIFWRYTHKWLSVCITEMKKGRKSGSSLKKYFLVIVLQNGRKIIISKKKIMFAVDGIVK